MTGLTINFIIHAFVPAMSGQQRTVGLYKCFVTTTIITIAAALIIQRTSIRHHYPPEHCQDHFKNNPTLLRYSVSSTA